METIKVDLNNITKKDIERIVNSLKRDEVCTLPSDTSYALCARADKKNATDKVYQIKKRNISKPLSVFVRDMKMIKDIALIDERVEIIIKKYLPGSYTFILEKRKNILDNIATNNKTIGVRWIESELLDVIFQQINFPLTATSANISDQAPVYNPEEIKKIFNNKIIKPNLIIDTGLLTKITPSTLVDLTSKEPLVLRQGQEKFQ